MHRKLEANRPPGMIPQVTRWLPAEGLAEGSLHSSESA